MIFLENKYSRWYRSLIQKASRRDVSSTVTEKHHIVPACLGGSDEKKNLVDLTPREHFVVHWLLTKMIPAEKKKELSKILLAYSIFAWPKSNTLKRKLTSRQFQSARTAQRRAISLINKGRVFTEEHKRNMRLAASKRPKQKPHTKEVRMKIAESNRKAWQTTRRVKPEKQNATHI